LGSIRSASTNSSPASLSHTVRGYFFIAAAALFWGASAALGRAVFTGRLGAGAVTPVEPLILSQSRTTISFIVLALVLIARRGTGVFGVPRRDLWRCLALGVFGVAAANYLYYVGIQRTNVATAIILQYTAPIWVLLYGLTGRRERPTLQRVGAVALTLCGLMLAIGVAGQSRFRLDVPGILASLAAAFSFAYYNVSGAALLQRYDRWRVLLLALMGAAVFWQLVNPPWRVRVAHYTETQWLFMLVFAVTSVLLPFSCYFAGLQYLQSTRAIVTSCLEPVFSILIAAAALGEVVSPSQILGIAVVLAATILVQMNHRTGSRIAPVAAEQR
jgi:DME family drug/metabolite transporter